MHEAHEIIQTASLTEKSTLMGEKQNKYVFRDSPRANKIQIKNAIERLVQKKVVEPKKKTGGRNNYGRLTSRHIGGGHKQKYRKVDFKRRKRGVAAEVIAIEYDPNRSARIALIKYADGELNYILAPNGLRVGSTV